MEPLPATREALAEFVSLEDPDVDELLHDLGRQARSIVPELIGLSLALAHEGLTFTLVASSSGLAALDAMQYLDGGPCVDVTEGRSERHEAQIGDMLDESEWQLFAQTTAAAGVASTLSMPVYRHDHLVGGVNLYASSRDAFTGHHDELAKLLGSRAAEAVTNADLSFSTRFEAAAAPGRLRERADIETAVGLLAAQRHITVDEARELLTQAAAQAGVDEVLVARVMILVHQRRP